MHSINVIMDDPLLETKLDFDEYLKQVSERSVSKAHVRGAKGTKPIDVRKTLNTIGYKYLFGMVRC
jgi:hypothetical protein